MKFMLRISLILGLVAGAGAMTSAGSAWATAITDSGDPLLNGASVIDFSEVPEGTENPTIGLVSFAGDQFGTPFPVRVVADTTGDFSLLNNFASGNVGTNIDITFSTPVFAFGADFFAVNSLVTLQAFDIFGDLLGSLVAFDPADRETLAGFRGLGGFGAEIASARVITRDILQLDNFRVAQDAQAVPEPGSLAILLIGLTGLAFARRSLQNA